MHNICICFKMFSPFYSFNELVHFGDSFVENRDAASPYVAAVVRVASRFLWSVVAISMPNWS